TELAAVPKELVENYHEALNGPGVEPALLLRLEKSVVASPFWIRGSYLAATVASRLAMDEVAEAIRQASARFVRRVPALLELCFSDGTAFVDDPTRAWLSATPNSGGPASPVQEYGDLREELVAQLNN
ncbi:type VI secretion system domain-containing protein, partial [Paenibacillus polymyxa]|uniref:type VI secretion system domain-containing protein n=1 Tax=Paenibacillus polymyxa TaxID=1406 RepID=UPI00307E5729